MRGLSRSPLSPIIRCGVYPSIGVMPDDECATSRCRLSLFGPWFAMRLLVLFAPVSKANLRRFQGISPRSPGFWRERKTPPVGTTVIPAFPVCVCIEIAHIRQTRTFSGSFLGSLARHY